MSEILFPHHGADRRGLRLRLLLGPLRRLRRAGRQRQGGQARGPSPGGRCGGEPGHQTCPVTACGRYGASSRAISSADSATSSAATAWSSCQVLLAPTIGPAMPLCSSQA